MSKRMAVGSSSSASPEVGSSSSASPRWIKLPSDLTAKILQRLGSLDTLSIAQFVCTDWWKVYKEPSTWRVIDLREPQNPPEKLAEHLESIGTDGMCRLFVDLSKGQSISIHVEDLVQSQPLLNETLIYISKRLPFLRRLSLANCSFINGRALARAVERLVVLEELHLTAVDGIHTERIKTIGHSRPLLKSFTSISPDDPEKDSDLLLAFEDSGLNAYLDDEGEEPEEGGEAEEGGGGEAEDEGAEGEEEPEDDYFEDDPMSLESSLGSKYAEAIAQSMPNLRHLALRANPTRNVGIEALLDRCLLLESLDIRDCYRVDLSGGLRERLQRIKDVKL